ncbi:mitochondrial WD40 domain-containing protein [Andalucia godoyi]|uniref:Mitochondrial WD40 domain-containing protein n=1 Tax=Andalucia godoyi TaxID=505711 RepID=A0A8K0F2L8_ANDGO|nr:mitochondrial WD40 domain-containing protein [Andalucia godoyi]|eukprot:ANDGO_02266.mRNA.1 mitochondrial WD40 domain-containing protein
MASFATPVMSYLRRFYPKAHVFQYQLSSISETPIEFHGITLSWDASSSCIIAAVNAPARAPEHEHEQEHEKGSKLAALDWFANVRIESCVTSLCFTRSDTLVVCSLDRVCRLIHHLRCGSPREYASFELPDRLEANIVIPGSTKSQGICFFIGTSTGSILYVQDSGFQRAEHQAYVQIEDQNEERDHAHASATKMFEPTIQVFERGDAKITALASVARGGQQKQELLVSGAEDGAICFWSVANRTLLKTVHTGEQIDRIFQAGRDGRLVVAQSSDGSLTIVNLNAVTRAMDGYKVHRKFFSTSGDKLWVHPTSPGLLFVVSGSKVQLVDAESLSLVSCFSYNRSPSGHPLVAIDPADWPSASILWISPEEECVVLASPVFGVVSFSLRSDASDLKTRLHIPAQFSNIIDFVHTDSASGWFAVTCINGEVVLGRETLARAERECEVGDMQESPMQESPMQKQGAQCKVGLLALFQSCIIARDKDSMYVFKVSLEEEAMASLVVDQFRYMNRLESGIAALTLDRDRAATAVEALQNEISRLKCLVEQSTVRETQTAMELATVQSQVVQLMETQELLTQHPLSCYFNSLLRNPVSFRDPLPEYVPEDLRPAFNGLLSDLQHLLSLLSSAPSAPPVDPSQYPYT